MNVLHAFFATNLLVLRFGQGLVFFLMGFAIWLTLRHSTELTLGRSLKLLGYFGITQAFADWGQAFIPIQSAYLSATTLVVLQGAATLLLGVSFSLLLWFAVALLADTFSFEPQWRWVTALVLVAWLALLGGFLVRYELTSQASGLLLNYGLALPGSILSVWALLAQRDELRRVDMTQLSYDLNWLAASFGIYAVVAGLIGPAAGFFPAGTINERSFFDVTGVPIHVLRGISGLAMTFFTVRLLEVFTLENRRRLEAADRLHSVSAERDRIARDLHDSTIQSLYGVGLSLEAARMQLGDREPDAAAGLDAAVARLGETISDIRRTILDLKKEAAARDALGPTLRALAAELREHYARTDHPVHIDVQVAPILSGAFSYEELSHISHIVREAISNAVRHSGAGSIEIRASIGSGLLVLTVYDDGRGFDPTVIETTSGWGLKNMRQRALVLGGELRVASDKSGTTVRLELPLLPHEPEVKTEAVAATRRKRPPTRPGE